MGLWQKNQGAISRTLIASEADAAARQDLKQDIFLALHQSAARLKAAEMPRAYLFRIVPSACTTGRTHYTDGTFPLQCALNLALISVKYTQCL
nr:sigma factor [Arsukibacterium sp. MJ3]